VSDLTPEQRLAKNNEYVLELTRRALAAPRRDTPPLTSDEMRQVVRFGFDRPEPDWAPIRILVGTCAGAIALVVAFLIVKALS
jgi:hypothetical protein